MDYLIEDEEERNLFAANVAWLEEADPDDWHRVALDFNWSNTPYVLDWIVRQPDCDAATALTIFWKGEPGCWIEKEEDPDSHFCLNQKICIYIANCIKEGNYQRSNIAFYPDVYTKKDFFDLSEEENRLESPMFRTHTDLIRKRRGRKVVNDAEFYRRYPEQFHYSVLIELPDPTPSAIAFMETIKRIEQQTLRLLPSWLRKT